jgi:SAM-dependent methyltransferase
MTSRSPIAQVPDDARTAAYAPDEFIGQESFMTASEILGLARQAGLGPGVRMLDLCCGGGGADRYLTSTFGCSCVGIDESAEAVAAARECALGLPCDYRIGTVPPLPPGPFDVVLVLETFLAFADKQTLIAAVSQALLPGGRFAFTFEEGHPLTATEHAAMPQADTVWPTPLPELESLLIAAGFVIRWRRDDTRTQMGTVERLLAAFSAYRSQIAAVLGQDVIAELIAGHRLWRDWIRAGRIRKFALVAQKL